MNALYDTKCERSYAVDFFITKIEKNPKGLDNAVEILHLASMFLLNFKVNPIHKYIFINLIYLSLYLLYIYHFMEGIDVVTQAI